MLYSNKAEFFLNAKKKKKTNQDTDMSEENTARFFCFLFCEARSFVNFLLTNSAYRGSSVGQLVHKEQQQQKQTCQHSD